MGAFLRLKNPPSGNMEIEMRKLANEMTTKYMVQDLAANEVIDSIAAIYNYKKPVVTVDDKIINGTKAKKQNIDSVPKVISAKTRTRDEDPAVKRANEEKRRRKKIDEVAAIFDKLDEEIDFLDNMMENLIMDREKFSRFVVETSMSNDGQMHRNLEQKYYNSANELNRICQDLRDSSKKVDNLDGTQYETNKLTSRTLRYSDIAGEYELLASIFKKNHELLKSAREEKERQIEENTKIVMSRKKTAKRLIFAAVVFAVVFLLYSALSHLL